MDKEENVSIEKIHKVSEVIFDELNMKEVSILTSSLIETFIKTYGKEGSYDFCFKRKDNKEMVVIKTRKITMLINE